MNIENNNSVNQVVVVHSNYNPLQGNESIENAVRIDEGTRYKCQKVIGTIIIIVGPVISILSTIFDCDFTTQLAMSGLAWGSPILGMAIALPLDGGERTWAGEICAGMICQGRACQGAIKVTKVLLRLSGTAMVTFGAIVVNSDPREHPRPIPIFVIGGLYSFSPEFVRLIRHCRIGETDEVLALYEGTPHLQRLRTEEDISTSYRVRQVAGGVIYCTSMISTMAIWPNRFGSSHVDEEFLAPLTGVFNACLILAPALGIGLYSELRVPVMYKIALRICGIMVAASTYFPCKNYVNETEDRDINGALFATFPMLCLAFIVAFGPEIRSVWHNRNGNRIWLSH